ncbi:HAD family phosphatase [Streptomyces sp. BPTC-684]|uniref:HAD family hydrolase n=1 Tax=Streptomyces sp. BPTC-684 TaxID=3043734 RepID=UPI0024B132DF|nr:HAD family phosphatase [Streptomyces sp. BPTC-684]WHM40615.1 HAD family phosphatase [Streptomyces sp. BPTC-684]
MTRTRATRVPPTDAVVLDCDGTLVDTQTHWDRACAAVCAQHGVSLGDADRLALIGLHLTELGRALGRLLGRPAEHEALAGQVRALVSDSLDEGVTAMPGAAEFVARLSTSRPLAVVSNSPRHAVVQHLEHVGLADAFEVVLGSDDVDRPKPAPDLYRTACERLRVVPGRAVAVEDSAIGIRSARAAGLYVVAVPSSPGPALSGDALYTTLAEPELLRSLLAVS